MGEELRRYRRVRKSLVVSVKERHVDPDKVRAFESVTRDLGEGGLFIESKDPPPKGTILEVEFEVPETGEKITTLALVRWTNTAADTPGMGVRLARFKSDDLEAFSRYVQANAGQVEKDSRELEDMLGNDQ